MLKSQKAKLPNTGFTLLELVVVLMMLGVLSAMTWPVLIRQVAKAKETEAIQMLSSVGFLQQGYFFEHRQFASDYGVLGVNANGSHFDFPVPNTPAGGNYTISEAVTKNAGLDASRNYSLGVYYDINTYRVILCQSASPGGVVSAPSVSTGGCSGGIQID